MNPMELTLFKHLPTTSNPFKISDIYDKAYSLKMTKASIKYYLQKLREKKFIKIVSKGLYSYTDIGLLQHILYIYSIDDTQMLREIFINNS